MFDLVSLGEILIDFTPCGVTEQGIARFARNPGGAPANVLAMNSKLGGSSAFVGKVGQDAFGAYLKSVLVQHGINVSALRADPEIPTTLAFVQLDETGDRSFTFYRKPGADLMLRAEEIPAELLADCRIFHYGSVSLTGEPCRTAAFSAVQAARAQGCLISFDPNYRPALWEDVEQARCQIKKGIASADILKVSEEEMQLVTGESDPERGSAALLKAGPKAVFVSLGEKGAYYRNAACCGHCPAYRVDTIDTTGAGDAFVGALLWQLKGCTLEQLSGMELRDVVQFANAAGSLTTTRSGAIPALPTMDEIRTCVRRAEYRQ